VYSFQVKSRGPVIKVRQLILPVVAIQAGCAKILAVLDDKGLILFHMAQ
jgi:hypothetical protein